MHNLKFGVVKHCELRDWLIFGFCRASSDAVCGGLEWGRTP